MFEMQAAFQPLLENSSISRAHSLKLLFWSELHQDPLSPVAHLFASHPCFQLFLGKEFLVIMAIFCSYLVSLFIASTLWLAVYRGCEHPQPWNHGIVQVGKAL